MGANNFPVLLRDYRPPARMVQSVGLDIRLNHTATIVRSEVAFHPQAEKGPPHPIRLDGSSLTLSALRINGKTPPKESFVVEPKALTLVHPPTGSFLLQIETLVDPSRNQERLGLFLSGDTYCTQCEPQGFRRLTYFPDRPDILAVYTTRIEADLSEAPVLLSNGNRIDQGKIAGTNRHFAVWHDPIPKPCYIFAIVAGLLDCNKSSFIRASGRPVELAVFYPPDTPHQSDFAMEALKKAMAWDEHAFGREYDLEVLSIVALPNFRGAMENKGLIVSNERLVLASSETATDEDLQRLEATVAHEYFHNWTGNRVTCRDWFQLGLKEGLTLYREQEFMLENVRRSTQRIHDVRVLRSQQFGEDQGPLARAVVPNRYDNVETLYTATAYEKSAEIVRMLETFCGKAKFRQRIISFLQKYDGRAITFYDFLDCFSDIIDVSQFQRWYTEPGFPVVAVSQTFDQDAGVLTLDVAQHNSLNPDAAPMLFPLRLRLLDKGGRELSFQMQYSSEPNCLTISKSTHRFSLTGISQAPIVSMNQNFSAAVKFEIDTSFADLGIQAVNDRDMFNRWEAIHALFSHVIAEHIDREGTTPPPSAIAILLKSIHATLSNEALDAGLKAQLLVLPSEDEIAVMRGRDVDPDAIFRARRLVAREIGVKLESILRAHYASANSPEMPASGGEAMGVRALKNTCLDFLACADAASILPSIQNQYENARNMTDRLAALRLLLTFGDTNHPALTDFYDRFCGDGSALDKWFSVQATIPHVDTPGRVKELMRHPRFSMSDLNRVRALIGAFANRNPTQFNRIDGEGYELVAQTVLLLDKRYPLVAVGLLRSFQGWTLLEPRRRAIARSVLERLASVHPLSTTVNEIVARLIG
jgi:aminopeptidase N